MSACFVCFMYISCPWVRKGHGQTTAPKQRLRAVVSPYYLRACKKLLPPSLPPSIPPSLTHSLPNNSANTTAHSIHRRPVLCAASSADAVRTWASCRWRRCSPPGTLPRRALLSRSCADHDNSRIQIYKHKQHAHIVFCTHVIWLGTRQQLSKLNQVDKKLHLPSDTQTATATARNLDVNIDEQLTLDAYAQHCSRAFLPSIYAEYGNVGKSGDFSTSRRYYCTIHQLQSTRLLHPA